MDEGIHAQPEVSLTLIDSAAQSTHDVVTQHYVSNNSPVLSPDPPSSFWANHS